MNPVDLDYTRYADQLMRERVAVVSFDAILFSAAFDVIYLPFEGYRRVVRGAVEED